MTVLTHLNNLSSELVLTDTEKSNISVSLNTLAAKLNAYFGSDVKEHFSFGSYPRVTILPRKADAHSDVDYMIVFSTTDGQKKPQTYLDRLKKFANEKYSTSEIYQSHPTLVLSLNHIKFELVPAVYNYGYMIPSPSPSSSWQEWTYTDPAKANQALLDKNIANNYAIKPLVRLIKYWNAKQGYPYTSFSLEQYIINRYYFGCSSLKDYFYQFWSDFNANFGDSQTTKDKVARAKKYAAEAKSLESNNCPYLAEDEIKKIVPAL